LSALLAAIQFSVASTFRLDFRTDIFTREFIFGFAFTFTVWWYNISGFQILERRWLQHWNIRLRHLARIGSTLMLSYLMVWVDERTQLLHIDWDLEGYVFPEYANEFRSMITASIVLLMVFLLDTARKFHNTRMENERLKLENSVAQFEMLKQQINPHFLFNSLNILKTMVKHQDPNAEEYVLRLSDLYRSLLVSNQREKVPLSEELAALNNYLFMLKARFEDKLIVTMHLKSNGHACFMPPFTLQMLVENCIKHNVVSAERPLHIELFEDDSHVVVRNNLQPKRSVEDSNHIGLKNINQRYKVLSGQDIEIEHSDSHFTVKLPIINH
jgi:sensor histidine kinase YesM